MTALLARLGCVLVITAFALAGQSSLLASQVPNDGSGTNTTAARITVRGTEVREFDWAKSQARAHITYVSSGPRTQSARMIDNDLQTAFQFSKSDRSPTVIVELAKSAPLHRVSTAFRAEAKLDVYLLQELPKDVADLRFAKPDMSVVDLPDERGIVSVDFSVSSARYVALRWTRSTQQEPFQVAEISAFSNDPPDLSFGEAVHLADNTNTLAVTEPPLIPYVSP